MSPSGKVYPSQFNDSEGTLHEAIVVSFYGEERDELWTASDDPSDWITSDNKPEQPQPRYWDCVTEGDQFVFTFLEAFETALIVNEKEQVLYAFSNVVCGQKYFVSGANSRLLVENPSYRPIEWNFHQDLKWVFLRLK